MTAGSGEADRCSSQGLLKHGRGTSGMAAILNISGKMLNSVEVKTPCMFRIERDGVTRLLQHIVTMKKTEVYYSIKELHEL